eukprot:CAMPEP_0168332222 /NCGR_PEP_ID=MMETSP0213-20121227/8830_1 /TAXON_ID=151035 /ORGANISM="Euplotes harpa, Strain FSP1.4" /LENGTH=68 /DNA_ID=CAMNT_0008336207 /DNA_START=780 /DNA_END=986 /DNA_ORIENTATION=+
MSLEVRLNPHCNSLLRLLSSITTGAESVVPLFILHGASPPRPALKDDVLIFAFFPNDPDRRKLELVRW